MGPTPTTRFGISRRRPGLKAIAEGFRHLGLADDHEILAKEFVVYDALYAYCRAKTAGER